MPVVPVTDTSVPWPFIFMQITLALMVALPGIISAYRQGTVIKAQKDTHDLVNSRLTELLKIAKESSRAEGVLEGKAAAELKQAAHDTAVRKGKVEAQATEKKAVEPEKFPL